MSPLRTTRPAVPLLAAVALAPLLAVTGCAAQPEPGSMSREEKIAQLQDGLDSSWSALQDAHPDLALGPVPAVEVVPDDRVERRVVECFLSLGIDARGQFSGGIVLEESPTAAVPVEVAQQMCWGAIVGEQQLDWIWNQYDQQRMWLHDVHVVQPCLERFGIHVDPPPPFAWQLAHPEAAWSVWTSDELSTLPPDEWERISESCPFTPRWLT